LLQVVEAGRILAEVHKRTLQLGDDRRLVQVTGFLAGHAYLTQSSRASASLAERALHLAQKIGDDSLQIVPNVHLGQALHGLGEFERSVDVLKRNLAILSHLDKPRLGLPTHPLIMTWRWMALSLAELGSFDEAVRLATGMVPGDTSLQPTDQLYSRSTLGFVQLVRGDFPAARDATADAMAIAEEYDLPFMIPVVASQLGLILAYLGQPQDGVKLARRAVRAAEELDVSAGKSRWDARLSECLLLADDPAEGMRHAEAALECAEAGGEQGYACYALRLRGKIQASLGNLVAARDDIAEAMRRAHPLSMAPLIGKCAIELAALDWRRDGSETALGLQAQAIAEFERLGMDAWAARAKKPTKGILPGPRPTPERRG
jgi:ATP/maltotriose-dependent transcriptional regulator MalT